MTFGDDADEEACSEIYTMCRDKGINFFDCANVYAEGESERILGRLIKGHRDKVIISSKAYYPVSNDVNGSGLSRLHLTKALDSSLKNFGTDYIDVYYLHSFDEETQLEESLSTLNDFVRQGKILYIGLSNFAAWQVMKAASVASHLNLAPVTCIQPMYNLLKRQCESEILPMAQQEKLGVFSYGPLAGGYLTGKYLSQGQRGGRFDTAEPYQKRYEASINIKTVEQYTNFARENGYDPVSLAISWAASHPAITAPIIGARSAEQLAPTLASLKIPMTPELRKAISSYSLAPALPTDREEERR
jgi:aryl-alcohol dehydrogenase-like predicted oxidoreductase